MNAEQIAEHLGLEPHPEGGFYRESYRAKEAFSAAPADKAAGRAVSSAIYYLLTPETFSEMHRLDADEVWHHYLGDPVEQLQLGDGESKVVVLGGDLAAGQLPQLLTPRGVWQGSRVLPGEHGYALLGTTMAPSFEFAGYQAGTRAELTASHPEYRDLIRALTRR